MCAGEAEDSHPTSDTEDIKEICLTASYEERMQVLLTGIRTDAP